MTRRVAGCPVGGMAALRDGGLGQLDQGLPELLGRVGLEQLLAVLLLLEGPRQARQQLERAIEERATQLAADELNQRLKQDRVDVTLPVRPEPSGRIHPVTQVLDEATAALDSQAEAEVQAAIDRLAEHRRKVDWRNICWIGLTRRLGDRHRRQRLR